MNNSEPKSLSAADVAIRNHLHHTLSKPNPMIQIIGSTEEAVDLMLASPWPEGSPFQPLRTLIAEALTGPYGDLVVAEPAAEPEPAAAASSESDGCGDCGGCQFYEAAELFERVTGYKVFMAAPPGDSGLLIVEPVVKQRSTVH